MAKVFVDISMSLDGFVAGPEITLEEPLGKGGERLHDWVVRLAGWREQHGLEGGETGPDDELVRAIPPRVGAVVMGRKMFSSGSGPWVWGSMAQASRSGVATATWSDGASTRSRARRPSDGQPSAMTGSPRSLQVPSRPEAGMPPARRSDAPAAGSGSVDEPELFR